MNATANPDTLLEEALRLPAKDRSRMATRLIESLDDEIGVSPAWQVEIERRVESIRTGASPRIGHEAVIGEAKAILAALSSQNVGG